MTDDGDGAGGVDGSAAELRAYDPDADREALWALKREFELELGAGTGDEGKADRYEGKLTEEYRERYLQWVERCVASDPYCVTVAEIVGSDGGEATDSVAGDGGGTADGGDGATGAADGVDDDVDREIDDDTPGVDGTTDGDAGTPGAEEPALAGYVFVLPWDLAMIWDAAVLNEVYVREHYRGTGVADDLMDAAVDLARDQDPPLPRLVLDVDRANDRARAFYRRHGFEHWGEMVAREL